MLGLFADTVFPEASDQPASGDGACSFREGGDSMNENFREAFRTEGGDDPYVEKDLEDWDPEDWEDYLGGAEPEDL